MDIEFGNAIVNRDFYANIFNVCMQEDAHICAPEPQFKSLKKSGASIIQVLLKLHQFTKYLSFISGLCLERPGCTCVPKKSRHIKVDIVVGINSSSVDQMCSSYEIEEHRGPCRCKCLTKTCHYNKDFDRENCQCRCKPEFAALKRECATTGTTCLIQICKYNLSYTL